jgi:hypothetical protein
MSPTDPARGASAAAARRAAQLLSAAKRRAAALHRGDPVHRVVAVGRSLMPGTPENAIRTGLLHPSRRALELDDLDLHALRERSLDQVLAALGDLETILVPSAPHRSWRLALRATDRAAALRALGSLPRHWEVRVQERIGRIEAVPHFSIGHHLLRELRDLTVRIDVLDARADGFGGRTAGTYDFVRAKDWHALAADSLTEAARRHGPPEPDIQVDVVYTWVDGSDPAWQRRRDAALQQMSGEGARSLRLHPTSTDASRFEDSQELLHSLRSLHAFASWVRRIHIVTDSQVPDWLDVDHPAIHVVDHAELMGGSRFNSHAIEASLHRIPDLAEHYLYLNDDVFFGLIAYRGDFFAAPGVSRFFPSDLPIDPGPPHPEDLPIVAAAKNNRELVEERFGLEVLTKIRHTVHPQLRSVGRTLEEDFPERMAQTRDSLFRAPTDLSVASSLSHWYGYALSRAVPDTPNYLYLNLGDPGVGQTLDALASLRRYDTFCLNQERSDEATAAGVREMRRFLPRYFPLPAPWEKKA